MSLPAPSTATRLPWVSGAVVVGLFILIGLAYSNSFESGMVLDNRAIIGDDPRIKAATWENLYLIFTEDYWYPNAVGALFRPVTTLSLLFDYTICGYANNPRNYHWMNLGLHLVNASLFYALLLQLTRRFWVAVSAACLFALHPIATESVTNIVGRSDLFAATTVLAGLILYSKARSKFGRLGWSGMGGLWLITTIGMLAKENAIMIAAVIPLYDLIYHFQWTGLRRSSILQSLVQWLRCGYIAIIPCVICFFLIRYWMLRQHGPSSMAWIDNSLRASDFVSSRLTAMKIVGFDVWLLLYPVHLSCDYAFNAIPNCSWRMSNWNDWNAIAVIVGLGIAGFMIAKRFLHGAKAEAFFAGWFCITLLPTSNLLFLIDSNFAERFLYVPMIGFVGFGVVLIDSWTSRYRAEMIAIVLLPILCLFGWRTYLRNFDWRNDLTLWRSAVAVCPESCRAQRSFAWALHQEDPEHVELDRIISIAEKAVRIVQDLPDSHNDSTCFLNLGNFLATKAEQIATRDAQVSSVSSEDSQKLYERSIRTLERARQIGEAFRARHVKNLIASGRNPDDIPVVGPHDVYQSLAAIYSRTGRIEEAVRELRRLQAVKPKSPVVYRGLPGLLIQLGRLDEAIIVLIESMLIGLQTDLTIQQLVSVYSQRNTESEPALVAPANQISLNMDNGLVRRDVETAFVELITLSLRNKDMISAERGRQAAKDAGCKLEAIDELFTQLGPKNGAWSIKH